MFLLYSQHLRHLTYGFSLQQPILQLSRHKLSVLQFSCDTYLELAQTPQAKGSPTRLPPDFRHLSHVQVDTFASNQQAINQRFPLLPPQVSYLSEHFPELGKTAYLLDYRFIFRGYSSETARRKRYVGQSVHGMG